MSFSVTLTCLEERNRDREGEKKGERNVLSVDSKTSLLSLSLLFTHTHTHTHTDTPHTHIQTYKCSHTHSHDCMHTRKSTLIRVWFSPSGVLPNRWKQIKNVPLGPGVFEAPPGKSVRQELCVWPWSQQGVITRKSGPFRRKAAHLLKKLSCDYLSKTRLCFSSQLVRAYEGVAWHRLLYVFRCCVFVKGQAGGSTPTSSSQQICVQYSNVTHQTCKHSENLGLLRSNNSSIIKSGVRWGWFGVDHGFWHRVWNVDSSLLTV